MNYNTLHTRISPLYQSYNNVIKPLIAEIEVRMQAFPTPVINEIRAFNDHIARCYHENMSDDKISKEIDKAERHVVRIILDCYKYLIICLDDHLKDFENISRNIDLTKIDNGLFYPKYSLINNFHPHFYLSSL